MNPNQSTIIGAMSVTAGSVYLGAIAAGKPWTVRPAVGIVVAGAALLIAAESSSFGPIAAQLSVLVATTAVLTSGYYAAAGLARYFANA